MPHQQCHSFCYLSQGGSQVWVSQCKPILALDMHKKPVPSWPGGDSWVSAGKRHHVTGARAASDAGIWRTCVVYKQTTVCSLLSLSQLSKTMWTQKLNGVKGQRWWGAGIFPRDSTGNFLISWGLIWDKRLIQWAWDSRPVLGLMDPFP